MKKYINREMTDDYKITMHFSDHNLSHIRIEISDEITKASILINRVLRDWRGAESNTQDNKDTLLQAMVHLIDAGRLL